MYIFFSFSVNLADSFLGATKHLYNWLCPLVGRLVGRSVGLWGNAFVRRSTRRTLLAYLALFFCVKIKVSSQNIFENIFTVQRNRIYILIIQSRMRHSNVTTECLT